jgi:hypothetical protein
MDKAMGKAKETEGRAEKGRGQAGGEGAGQAKAEGRGSFGRRHGCGGGLGRHHGQADRPIVSRVLRREGGWGWSIHRESPWGFAQTRSSNILTYR